jgi:DNA-binding response OmpR family regulator
MLMKGRILWIEGKRADNPAFIPILRKKDFLVETVPTGAAALSHFSDFNPDLVVVNASSLRTNGKRICCDLRQKHSDIPILLILNPEQSAGDDVCANTVLVLPFTQRKLVNRIMPLLPGDGENLIHVGSIWLDLERKRVRCQEREARLTPRMAQLLHILMQHGGEVVERENLFRETWKTEYIGDTRTLDVHISWLRQAIEADPRKPKYLKTIRGVGYRLDT